MQIAGTQLNLRDMQVKDLDALQRWLHPSHEWHKFNGPYYPPMPAEKIPGFIEKRAKAIQENNVPEPRMRLVIVDKSDDIMGMVTRYWISEETNWTAIGIIIWNPENWSKGYGYDALGLWCEYLFQAVPEFVRLDARTWSGNTGMMKLADKLGFTQEACFRNARIVGGKYYDGLGYGILREEWEACYPDGFDK